MLPKGVLPLPAPGSAGIYNLCRKLSPPQGGLPWAGTGTLGEEVQP